MEFEIETKLKVDSHCPVEQKLLDADARLLVEKTQTDIYLDSTDHNFANADKALRIRCERTNDKDQTYITFKGPKLASDVKKRLEIEFEIAQAQKCEQLFEQLGFKRRIVVEKQRKSYALNDCVVELDTLAGLGAFVEIEGPDSESIKNVKDLLGLGDHKHIKKSYAKMVSEKLEGKI